MPTRFIRESALTSATLYRLSDGAERLFWRMILIADDFGRFEAEPQVLKAKCFPHWPDAQLNIRRIGRLYNELEAELVTTYVAEGKRYGVFRTWAKYQIVRAKTSKYPPLTSANICTHLLADASVSGILRIRDTPDPDSAKPSPAEREAPGPPPPASTPHDSDDQARPWPSAEALVELYNGLVPVGHPKVDRLSPARREKAARYLKAFPDKAFWVRVFTEIRHSALLRGLKPSEGHAGFRGDFDWLLTKGKDGTENCVKAAEGKYRDG